MLDFTEILFENQKKKNNLHHEINIFCHMSKKKKKLKKGRFLKVIAVQILPWTKFQKKISITDPKFRLTRYVNS